MAKHRPVVIITSNNEKELPDAFLRRCFFHYIRFPDRETMERIVQAHYPDIRKDLAREALNVFFQVREVPGLKKKPATSELLDWLKLLMVEDLPVEALRTQRQADDHSAAVRRAAEERAGRASVRASCFPGTSGRPDVLAPRPGFARGGTAGLHHRIPDPDGRRCRRAWRNTVSMISTTWPRATLVKDERHLDKFDRVFAHCFKGLEPPEGVKVAGTARRMAAQACREAAVA